MTVMNITRRTRWHGNQSQLILDRPLQRRDVAVVFDSAARVAELVLGVKVAHEVQSSRVPGPLLTDPSPPAVAPQGGAP